MNSFFYTRCCILGILLLPFCSKAQSINGIVTDGAGKAQEFATVMLLQSKDSSLVKGAITDSDGKYELDNIPKGNYYLSVSLVGFKTTLTPSLDYAGENYLATPVVLQTADNQLNTLTVTAKKPIIEVKADKTVFNVENSLSATGLNGLEVLRKSPGVMVDKDENVLLKGRQGVQVYINGKPSQLSGNDLAAYLKGLSSADIEAIEIISNPGAKFDAQGTAGVINIRLKKNKKMGTNGNISVGFNQGITPKTENSFSLNYRGLKWAGFGNYSYRWGRYDNIMNLDNYVNNLYYKQRSWAYWLGNDHNFKVGGDYFINTKNTVGVVFSGGISNPNFGGSSRTDIIQQATNRTDSTLFATTQESMRNRNFNYNLNYRFADTSGHELNMDADYGSFNNLAQGYLPNVYVNEETNQALTTRIYRTTKPVKIDIATFKVDYEQRLGKKGKISGGAKASDVVTDNAFNFYNVLNDQNIVDIDRTNKFVYHENILAAYLNYNTQINKWGIQTGLRTEHTRSRGTLTALKPVNNKDRDTSYINLFPTAALSYTISDKHSVNLTYRYSINRPRYQDLNPFENRIDELTFEKGNPFLQPQFAHSIEAGYTFMQAATATVMYSHTNNFFTQITDRQLDPVTNQETFFITNRNFSTKDEYNFSINAPMPIKKWWMGYLNFWLNYSAVRADFGEGKTVNINATGGGFYMQHSFTLSKTWAAEASGWYNWGGLWGNFLNKPQGVMDIGVSKKFWDGDGQLKLSFTDVFKTAQWASTSQLGGLRMDARGTWEGQQLGINFTYRFGNKQLQGARERKTGLEDEKGRIKSGK